MASLWDCNKCGYNHYELGLDCKNCGQIQDVFTAAGILEQAISTIAERGKTYDTDGVGTEHSMDRVAVMFNAMTGHNVTVAQCYKFMCCLKLAQSEQCEHKLDNYLDGAAYFALAGECAIEGVNDG